MAFSHKDECVEPNETDVRVQLFHTLQAVERMANAVTAHLTADRQPAEQTPQDGIPENENDERYKKATTAILPNELVGMRRELADHRRALALVSTFGVFHPSVIGMQPSKAIYLLARLSACECVGTGWIARDERCKACDGKGYLER